MVDTDRFICKIEEIINSSKPGEDNSANCILNLCKLLEEFEVALENETGEECINAGRRVCNN